jgi:hypothetical protein
MREKVDKHSLFDDKTCHSWCQWVLFVYESFM